MKFELVPRSCTLLYLLHTYCMAAKVKENCTSSEYLIMNSCVMINDKAIISEQGIFGGVKQMDLNADLFFKKVPTAQVLFDYFARNVLKEFPDVKIEFQKTQISFSNKHQFAFVWLPVRKIKNRPDIYIIVSFGLTHRLVSPRIVETNEPYPNRWTHHLIIQNQNEIDTELMDWIKEAHDFAATK